MKNITSPQVTIGFIFATILLIVNAWVASQSISTIKTNNQLEISSDKLLTILSNMLLALKDVERGQREYLLTNNPQYLESHRIDINEIRTELKSLKLLKLTTPQRWSQYQQQLEPVESQIDLHLKELTETIDQIQLHPRSAAQQFTLSQRGQQSIDRMRQLVTNLDRSAHSNLDRLHAGSQQSLIDAKISLGISGLLDLLLLVILYGLVNWDLTERQKTEAKLQGYVTEFEELYHSAPCGYHSLDSNENFLRINQTELKMLGYEESEIIGHKKFSDLLTPESVQTFRDYFLIVKKHGWIRDLEFQMVHKDGRIVPVSATAIAVYDAQGNYVTSRSTVIDISDRLRLRQQARLSAEISQKIRQSLQLTEILQTAVEEVQQLLRVDRVLILRFETDNSVTVVREQVLPGYPVVMESKIVDRCVDRFDRTRYHQGSSMNDITEAEFQPCYLEFLHQFAVKASAIVPIWLREELWGLLIVHQCQAPREWQHQELEMLIQLSTQIGIALTQSQLLEQEQIQRQELVRSNAELEQFAHVASHDLQEPLRMVISYLQLLERRYQGKLDADADEFIDYAVDGAKRMQALIQALLSYARVSSRGRPFELVNCNDILQDALSNLQVAITESSATIMRDPLPSVWGDATQLTQLFQNLIANAIKFRRDLPPQIQISVRQIFIDPQTWSEIDSLTVSTSESQIRAWCFAVADNGIGIKPEYLDRIFAIFQRLHTRVAYPGTGIGLAICKKIIERHGGKIWVESKSAACTSADNEHGSTFYFIIPEIGSIPQ